VPEDLQLRLLGQPPLSRAAQPGRSLGTCSDHGHGHQALRAVRAVDEAGRDLAGSVPAAQRGAGHAGIGGSALECRPVGAFELGVQLQLDLPVIEPVFPVHGELASTQRQ
jgi:hypothetical protein